MAEGPRRELSLDARRRILESDPKKGDLRINRAERNLNKKLKKAVASTIVKKRLELVRDRETTLTVWNRVAAPNTTVGQKTLDGVLQKIIAELHKPTPSIARAKLQELYAKLIAKGAREPGQKAAGERTGGQKRPNPKSDNPRDRDTRRTQKQAWQRDAREDVEDAEFARTVAERRNARASEIDIEPESESARRERELDEMNAQAKAQARTSQKSQNDAMWDQRRTSQADLKKEQEDKMWADKDKELNTLLGRYREWALNKGLLVPEIGKRIEFIKKQYERDPNKAIRMVTNYLENRNPGLILPGPEANPNAEIVRVNGGGKGSRTPTSPEAERRDYPLVKTRSSELAVRPKEERRDSLDSLEGVPEEVVDRAVRGEPGAEEELLRRVKEIQRVIGPEAFEKLINRIVNEAIKNGNKSLFDKLVEGPFRTMISEIRQAKGRMDTVLREQRENATENRAAHNELKELMNRLIASNSDPEVKRLLEQLSNALLDPATGEFRAIRVDLDKIIKNLDNLSNMIADRGEFGEFIKEMCTLAFKGEQRNFIVAMVQRFEEEFPMLKNMRARFDYIDQVMHDMVVKDKKDMIEIKDTLLDIYSELGSTRRGLGKGISKVIAKLRDIENFLDPVKFSKLIQDACIEALKNQKTDFIDAIMTEFDKKYPDLKTMKARFDKLEQMINDLKLSGADTDKIMAQMEEYYRDLLIDNYSNKEQIMDALQEACRDLVSRGEENKEEILDRLFEVATQLFDQANTNKDEILAKLDDLKDYFSTDAYKKIIEDIVKSAIADNNDTLIQKMKDAGFATKEDIEKIKAGTPGTPGEPGKDGDKGGKGGDTSKLEERLKKLEEKKPSIWRGLGYMGGGTLFLAILGLIALGLYKASQISHPSNASPISVVPVVGGTAKVATSSSILGSLGGINPIIIVLVLVALFLLFPKK